MVPQGMLFKSETRLNLENLAKQQAELAHETITLAKEVRFLPHQQSLAKAFVCGVRSGVL